MIKHHFFGKNCKIDRELADHSDLEKCLSKRNWEFHAINFVSQIHSDKVLVIDALEKIHGIQGLPKADAIVTNQNGLVICVVTADCAPIIFKDEKNCVIGIVHAGWRGAKGGVIQNAIDEMLKLGGSIDSIQAFIGPMIHQDSYQISREFYDDFLADDVGYAKFFKNDSEKGKFLFDLPKFVEDILRRSGISKIEKSNIDTYISDDYSSYRRSMHENGDLNNRNISAVIL